MATGCNDFGLPFQGSTPLSLHTSKAGADGAAKRAPSQLARYIRMLIDSADGATDHEAATKLGIPNTSVCARRGDLMLEGLIYAEGTRPGPDGTKNAIWRWRG